MTIDLSYGDIEIRITHDLDGDIGRIKLTDKGLLIHGHLYTWKELFTQ